MNPIPIEHGGPDGGPPADHDFSTNASPLGPPPTLWRAMQGADRQNYPDPAYRALRRQLAGAGAGMGDADLVLPTAGGAEGIRRLTLAALLAGRREAWVPQPGFGDYAAAAQALGLAVKPYAEPADIRPAAPALVWICEPCNPTGASAAAWPDLDGHLVAVDRAYAPLRLQGEEPAPPPGAWQLVCPNKALGLTGVRAGYLVAPAADEAWARALSLAPSWVLSAEGVALLEHWLSAETQAWLADARTHLRSWAASQRALLASLDWLQRPSCTNFWLARPPRPDIVPRLRERGIRVRDAASFGLDGWVRVSTQPPRSQAALQQALIEIEEEDS
ncbi:aminotransferase class I/II-fold pyridoxal phosphate-dependent enzyme [Roseateles saccharophilus]|uniref:histidinol-phosphate transaminase n=1 Tax=Roseateles saccharophilus TaxID=304 RepID=A0A4R3UTI0_ROSSA|nr:aminotransferase class I/II-fold pyridoxal phosphate-dependent enzyme [Roseateles saccharophilus]MDG0833257.1 aminotransferase class I/II-fold pyridoxal phosphate-dependent enzyme [Roseateles saccharophilus]TCU94392.1 histidinol-phosphate aminotransferase [Roseateles saccharophilus]